MSIRHILDVRQIDIIMINVFSICFILTLLFIPESTLRQFLAFPFVVFIPGYALLRVCYTTEELEGIERVALSFLLSLIVVPIIGLILIETSNFNPYYCSLSLYILIFIFSILSWHRERPTHVFRLKNISLRTVNILLSFMLIVLLGIFVRFYPNLKYSPLGGSWLPGNHFYPIYYTINTGHLLERGAIYTPTHYSSTIYNTLLNKAFFIFHSFFLIVAGITDLNEILTVSRYFPWPGTILFPLSVLLVASRMFKNLGLTVNSLSYLLISIIAVFGSFRFLVSSAFMMAWRPMGFSMVLASLYFLLEPRNDWRSLLFGIIFAMFILLYYYTTSIVFLVILLTVVFIQHIRKERVVSNYYVVIYLIFFISYHIYLARTNFKAYIFTLSTILEYFGAPYQYHLGRELVSLDVPIVSAYLNTMLITLLVILFAIGWIKKLIDRNRTTNLIFYMCIGLAIAMLLFFAWRGLKGVAGRSSYIALFSMLALIFLITVKENKIRKLTYIISIFIVVTAIVAYLPGTVMHQGYLTYPEEAAVAWYCKHDSKETYVLTDFRVGTAPVMLNCFSFTGPAERANPKMFTKVLEDVFYGNNPSNAKERLLDFRSSFVLLSREMINFGIFGAENVYKKMSYDGLKKYQTNYFGKVYDNEEVWYYYVAK